MATPVVDIEHLSKRVQDSTGELVILREIQLRVMAGETLAIVGASGSGKSTLLSLMAGLDVPSSGVVRLCGQSLFDLDEDQRAAHRARHVGFVFQNFQLVGHLNALENVMLPLELRGEKRARELASAMLERVGLSARMAHRPAVLSGGEQQRVALARAFVVRPDVLMADEPTGSLDHATGQSIIDLMMQLNQEAATALILVTHDRALAQRCHRQVTMQAGELLTSPT